MKTWIILLRGINIGGRNIIKMAALRETLAAAGFNSVRTYIQSGNIVLQSLENDKHKLENQIGDLIETGFGFRPKIMAVSKPVYAQTIADNPFSKADDAPTTLHVFYLGAKPENPDMETIKVITKDTEDFHLTDHAAYVYTPDGAYSSKLVRDVEKHLGVPATARNWRSVGKIWDMAATP